MNKTHDMHISSNSFTLRSVFHGTKRHIPDDFRCCVSEMIIRRDSAVALVVLQWDWLETWTSWKGDSKYGTMAPGEPCALMDSLPHQRK